LFSELFLKGSVLRNERKTNRHTAIAFRRILRRLREPLPMDPDMAHVNVLGYLERHGTKMFVHKLSWYTSASITPSNARVAETAKNAPAPAPAAPGLAEADSDDSRQAPPAYNPRALPEEPRPAVPPAYSPRALPNQGTPAFEPPPPSRAAEDPLLRPILLEGVPKHAITLEAMDAARMGNSPFGPPPLIERRSGYDRRSGAERRSAIDVVFKNRRFGGQRRKPTDRRQGGSTPKRPLDMTPDQATGNRRLRLEGWIPLSMRSRGKHEAE
jgi:hypothetical protein